MLYYYRLYFAATLLLPNLPSATHPPLPSAKRFFFAERQCYLEMKRNRTFPFRHIKFCARTNVF